MLTDLHAFSCAYPVCGWYTHIPLFFSDHLSKLSAAIGENEHWTCITWVRATLMKSHHKYLEIGFLMCGQQSQVVSLSEQCHVCLQTAKHRPNQKALALQSREAKHPLTQFKQCSFEGQIYTAQGMFQSEPKLIHVHEHRLQTSTSWQVWANHWTKRWLVVWVSQKYIIQNRHH